MSTLIALLSAALIYAYWIRCRRAALKHQTKAVRLIELFLEDDSVNEKDKDIAYGMYFMARRWIFMPIMAIAVPLVFVIGIIRGDMDSRMAGQDRRQQIMDSIMQMYMTKNPLTTIICMVMILSTLMVLVPVGIVLNRIRSMPSTAAFYGVIAHASATVSHTRNH